MGETLGGIRKEDNPIVIRPLQIYYTKENRNCLKYFMTKNYYLNAILEKLAEDTYSNIPKSLIDAASKDPKLEGFVDTRETARRVGIYDKKHLVGFFHPRRQWDGWRAGATYVKPEMRGKGLASKAIKGFFENKKGYAYIEPDNLLSMSAFKKAGFVESHNKKFSDGSEYKVFIKPK